MTVLKQARLVIIDAKQYTVILPNILFFSSCSIRVVSALIGNDGIFPEINNKLNTDLKSGRSTWKNNIYEYNFSHITEVCSFLVCKVKHNAYFCHCFAL